MLQISRYQPTEAQAWNRFVLQAKNATFLFNRNYMDYHQSRFEDHSLVVSDRGHIVALLPANITPDRQLVAHQGLTYGALLTTEKTSARQVISIFRLINNYLKENNIRHVTYKAVPWIYHRLPAEEDLYALSAVCHARLTRRDISSVVFAHNRLKFAESRRSGIRKATRQGVLIDESRDLGPFWDVLTQNLQQKYGVNPVHSLDEITLLRDRFPQNIRLYTATLDGQVVGGTLLYLTPQVLHTQYISASPIGKACGAIDLMFEKIFSDNTLHYLYIDFGRSTESDFRQLNERLIFQKEGFGARGVCYDTYEWDI